MRLHGGWHLNEESKKGGRNKRSVSGADVHAANGLVNTCIPASSGASSPGTPPPHA